MKDYDQQSQKFKDMVSIDSQLLALMQKVNEGKMRFKRAPGSQPSKLEYLEMIFKDGVKMSCPNCWKIFKDQISFTRHASMCEQKHQQLSAK